MNENTKKFLSATATPLASIFGSGFLVIVPILAGAVGPYSWLAMICVCGLAYAVGSVIRFNSRHAEPLMEDGKAAHRAVFFERTSDLALVIAYAFPFACMSGFWPLSCWAAWGSTRILMNTL